MRQILLLLLLILLLPIRARGQEKSPNAFRITSQVAESEIVLIGGGLKQSSMAPLAIDELATGRYEVRLYRGGVLCAKTTMDAGDRLRLSDRRGSRVLLSAIVPGLGQLRDFRWGSGLVPMAEVGTAIGQAFRYSAKVHDQQQVLDTVVAQTSSADKLTPGYGRLSAHLQDNVWLEEQTRNNYAYLALYSHVGNILHAAVRRGPYRFELSGTRSVAARYLPPSKTSVGFLSLLYPGLGQTRLGYETRGLLWSSLGFVAGMTLVETQRFLDQRTVSEQDAGRIVALEAGQGGVTPEALARWATAQGDVESAKSRRRAVIFGMGALWILNVADAIFLEDDAPVPLENGRIGALGVDLRVAWVGEAPGLSLARRF